MHIGSAIKLFRNTSLAVTLINIYALNIEASKYMKHILVHIKGEIDSNTVIAGYFNPLLTSMNRYSIQKINKGTVALNDSSNHMDVINILENFTPKQQNTVHSFQVHLEHFKKQTALGHKTSLNKFEKMEIISGIFSDHNVINLEINYKKKIENHRNTWKLTTYC